MKACAASIFNSVISLSILFNTRIGLMFSSQACRRTACVCERKVHVSLEYLGITVKPVSNSHSKIGKTKIIITIGSLLKVKSIAEFCNTFDLHLAIIGLKTQFSVFFRVAVLHRLNRQNKDLNNNR